ncbi:PepSY domain-containing protein [Streptomyces sp. NPDC052016]|uniref:PepSY domain-containing protein n=1 Tax=Streptomyces sp. NPDC052016 TaxID=3365680 RepID=UPI0037D11FBB
MKRKLVIAAVAATAVIGGGAAVAFADGDARGGTQAEVSDTRAQGDAGKTPADGTKAQGDATGPTAAEAIAAALKERPGTVVSADLDDDRDDDGGDDLGWEIDILGKGATSYTVLVDPSNGRILGTETDRDDDADERRVLKGADVTAARAAEAAAATGVVTSVDLDDDGDGGWDVETTDAAGKEHDWTVGLEDAKVTVDRHDDRGTDETDTDDSTDDGDDD